VKSSAWLIVLILTCPEKGAEPSFDHRNDVPAVYFDIAPAYGITSASSRSSWALASRILTIRWTSDSFHAEDEDAARRLARICRNVLDASLKILEQPAPDPVGASKLN
jgi:hypothetical protein